MRVLPYGPTAALIEVDGSGEAIGVAASLREVLPADVAIVPGAVTVLVDGVDPAAVVARLDGLEVRPPASDGGELVTIAVEYDGVDLDWVASTCGLSIDDIVAAHTAPTYLCAFCGFTPGFAYLAGLDPRLVVPRRERPRARVPAGAVAIAGDQTAVYPRATPGGWRVIGRTDAPLWDVDRAGGPALIVPGTRVRFVPR